MTRGIMLVQDRTHAQDRLHPDHVRVFHDTHRLKVDIYSDGADVNEMLAARQSGMIRGFTTNPTLMRKAGVTDYEAFARVVLTEIKDLPISFEVFADDFQAMERQALRIASWGDNVFVKIPITNTAGASSVPLIKSLVDEGVKLNVTAVMNLDQVSRVVPVLSESIPSVISVFAGRIADTGRDPVPLMREAVKIASAKQGIQVLWASPREVLNVYQADACGCHIITVTKALLDKLPLRGMDLAELSRDTVKMFYTDAKAAGFTIHLEIRSP
jgi:transaldolase